MLATDFPNINKAISRLDIDLKELDKAIAAGGLNKTGFKALRERFNNIFDYAWTLVVSKPFEYDGRWQDLSPAEKKLRNSWSLTPECHTAAGVQKKIEKSKLDTPFVRAMAGLLKEMVPLADAVNAFKDKIIARPVKTEEEKRPKYVAPHASRAAAKAVSDVLVAITTEHFARLKAHIAKEMNDKIAAFLAKQPNAAYTHCTYDWPDGHGRLEKKVDMPRMFFLRETCVNPDKDDVVSVRSPKADAFIEKKAQRDAEDAREHFLIKNMKKLDSILEAKGDFDRVELLKGSLSTYFMEGTLIIYFKDGSRFTAHNSIVWSTSSLGNAFVRYPLTFHGVMIAGKPMKSPSEQRMNTVFVGKT